MKLEGGAVTLEKERKSPKTSRKAEETLFSDRAYSLLRKMILSLEFSPKEPLSELKLAAKLGMSRTPVREALKKLKNENIILSYDKKGYFLNVPTIKEIKDIYEVRAILEGGAAKIASQRIDLNKLENFEKQFLEFRKKLNGNEDKRNTENLENLNHIKWTKEYDFVKLGREFHFFIIDSCENGKLKELIKSIYDQLEISRTFSYDKRRKEAVDEHLKVVNALKERDGEKSQISMEEHLKNAFNVLTKIL